ncbi:Primase zinc finger family protein [Leishmania donovani]|uniref:Primase zinc finger family protein n=1 Tax=Leishmania donovani TaxID=5661 RepID=A0A504Y1A7_LEIDO|nr:Primase zinc finger family protein [Leishmania donovani]
MSDDLFDIFNGDTPPLAPVDEVMVEVGDASAPSATLPEPRTGSLTSTTPATRLDGTGDAPTIALSTRSSASPAALNLLPIARTSSSASSPPPTATTALVDGFLSPDSLPQSFAHYERGAAPSLPRTRCATPLPLPPSASGGVTVIKAAPSPSATSTAENRRRSSHGDRGGAAPREGAVSRLASAPPPSALITEPLSRIRVRHATLSLEQLSVRLAEFPFASFDLFRGMSRRSDEAVARTCVGVVTRKSDPRQSTTATRSSRYAVLTLWNMESISPAPETELSVLLCGSAFDFLYSRLATGTVVALSNVARCARRASAPAHDTDEVLLRVADSEAVRQLGFAADLGTCASVTYKSKERCHTMVNTQRSQHCIYHVAGLRKAARSGDTVGTERNATHGARGASASSLGAPATMKGSTLTTHLTLSGAQQRLAALAPAGVAQRLADHHPAGSSGRASHRSGPVTNSRLAASQQMLRQTSFFAVRGATGLPVENAALRNCVNSAASGVYGGVQTGAPLALRQQVGLRPAASYPSAHKLGVTSRGRDVLEAARQQAVHHEEEKLLRRQLRRGRTASTTGEGLPNHARTDGGGSSGGDALNVDARAPSRSTEGVTGGRGTRTPSTAGAQKRARMEVAPSSSLATFTEHATSPCSYSSSPSFSPVASTASAATATLRDGADGNRVEALRQQFQPLRRGASAPFTPIRSHGAVHAVIASPQQRDHRHSVVMSSAVGSATGASASQNALFRAAIEAARDVTSNSTESTKSPPEVSTSASAKLHEAEDGAASALTLLGSVADGIHSAHDHLRSESDRQQLLCFVNKQITREKALEALEAITEQQIRAHYCYACRCWYGQPPTTCVEQHHRVELKPTLKKYIKCEHCNYKTFVIGGEEAKGWRVYPRCPRCHQSSFWVRGDAALQVPVVVEAPPPP